MSASHSAEGPSGLSLGALGNKCRRTRNKIRKSEAKPIRTVRACCYIGPSSMPFSSRHSSPADMRSFPATPARVDLSRVRWDYALPILTLHLLALLALVPWFFSWTGLIAFQGGICFFGQLGIPIGYHRLLTHRSFRVPKWLERCFVFVALCCGQNTPA